MKITLNNEWNLLLNRINNGKCTPFLGAGACYPALPLGSELALELAKKYGYPLEDSNDLARVAQFLATTRSDSIYPKEIVSEIIKERLKRVTSEYLKAPDEIHSVLAELPLPIYITTNYDDLMVKALKIRGKNPMQVLCRWNDRLKRIPESELNPTPEKPVVFHFHGSYEIPESLVLTEQDYLDFGSVLNERYPIPPRIEEALVGTLLLFLGYRISDWSFRSFYNSVKYRSLSKIHISVQIIEAEINSEERKKIREYLDSYFKELNIQMRWIDIHEFAAELKRRWDNFRGHN